MVAEDGGDAVARGKVRELARRERRVGRVEVDDVARDDDEIGPRATHEREPLVELALADERARVQVAHLRDDVAVEDARKARDAQGDLDELEGVPSPDHAPAQHRAGRAEDRRAAHALDDLAPRHRTGCRWGGDPRRRRTRLASRAPRHR